MPFFHCLQPAFGHRFEELVGEDESAFQGSRLALRLLYRRQARRRTRVESHFPNPDSCPRLVSALLAELDDEWMTGKVYLMRSCAALHRPCRARRRLSY